MGRVIGTVKELNSTYNSALSLGSYAPIFIGAGLSLGMLTLLGTSKTYSFPVLSNGQLKVEQESEKKPVSIAKNPGSETKEGKEKKPVLGGFLLTQDGCKHCPEALSDLAEHIQSGALRVVNIESKEGEALSRKYNIVRTPSIVPAVKKNGNIETLPTNTEQELPLIVGLAMQRKKEMAESLADIPEKKRDEAWFIPTAETDTYKSYKGQTEASYCAECLVKHFSRASTYLTEGIDRSLKDGQGVESKVREALKEIEGIKDDLPKKKVSEDLKQRFEHIDMVHREISKEIGAKGLGIKADKEALREIRGKVDDLLTYAYDTWAKVRQGEEEPEK